MTKAKPIAAPSRESHAAAAAGLDEAPIVLSGSRRKMGRIAAFSALFVAIGLWEVGQPGTWHGMPIAVVGVGALALGLGGAAASIAQLFRPPTLTLSSAGFTIGTITRSTSVRWAEVESFQPWRPTPRGPAMVGYKRRGRPRSKMEAMARGLGCDGAIPDHFPLPPSALLGLCEACRARWG